MTGPHRRYNPLLDEWVLVSPHRTQRPWQGQEEPPPAENRPSYDPSCYLCPGNARAGGGQNPAYEGTYVFANDYPAMLPSDDDLPVERSMFAAEPVSGECRVICFSPRHDETLATMSIDGIASVVELWREQVIELGCEYPWVQVFENHGSAMGASNPHPHGQIWASGHMPSIPMREEVQQTTHFLRTGNVLLLEYLAHELETRERVVCESEHWVWLVPYWAVWPFEVLLLPREHAIGFPDLAEPARRDLAVILKAGLAGFDRLFGIDFPYSMGWHGLPWKLEDWMGMELIGDPDERPRRRPEAWLLHAHFYPPLLRSATVRKHMVGYEMLAEPQRDITPEQAAERLRQVTPQV